MPVTCVVLTALLVLLKCFGDGLRDLQAYQIGLVFTLALVVLYCFQLATLKCSILKKLRGTPNVMNGSKTSSNSSNRDKVSADKYNFAPAMTSPPVTKSTTRLLREIFPAALIFALLNLPESLIALIPAFILDKNDSGVMAAQTYLVLMQIWL